MTDENYAFVDSRCPVCNGSGMVQVAPSGVKSCDCCHGTGLIGEYKVVPAVEYHGPCALATRLRITRERRKMSMADLSSRFGMSVVRLSDIERGRGQEITEREKIMIANWIYGGNTKMKAMLSQPMAGKTEEEIAATRERAIKFLEGQGFEVVNTLFTDEWYAPEAMKERGVENVPLCFLAKSLENMSKCHTAYFCHGWEQARGCRIEHAAAKAYGMQILYEDAPKEQLQFDPDKYKTTPAPVEGLATCP